jgi:hypothetical protein
VGAEQDKLLVRGLVEGITNGSLEVLDEVADDRFARAARQRIGPFRDSFPDFRMEVTGLIADEEMVAVHLRCSDTHWASGGDISRLACGSGVSMRSTSTGCEAGGWWPRPGWRITRRGCAGSAFRRERVA